MEASTYAWAVILIFFLLYGAIQLRKCFRQLLSSSGERNTTTNRCRSSVYTIESDSAVRSFHNDHDLIASSKKKDDLPTYEEVIASDKLNPMSHLSTTSEICPNSGGSIGTSSSNVTTTATTVVAIDR